jgi:hypothetical protein
VFSDSRDFEKIKKRAEIISEIRGNELAKGYIKDRKSDLSRYFSHKRVFNDWRDLINELGGKPFNLYKKIEELMINEKKSQSRPGAFGKENRGELNTVSKSDVYEGGDEDSKQEYSRASNNKRVDNKKSRQGAFGSNNRGNKKQCRNRSRSRS